MPTVHFFSNNYHKIQRLLKNFKVNIQIIGRLNKKGIWSYEVWNVTNSGLDGLHIGRFTLPGGQVFGADPTKSYVCDKYGKTLHELTIPLGEDIVQAEDFRAIPVVVPGREAFSLAFHTVVKRPENREGKVSWYAGVVKLKKNKLGKLEVVNYWEFPQLHGKNATPVKARIKTDGRIEVDFDVRLNSKPHVLSRYRAILDGNSGKSVIGHMSDNLFPKKWWNEAASGTGGGFIPYGEGKYEIGLVHGQQKIKEKGITKKKYYLGLAIRDEDGKVLWLSENPVVDPGDKDFRGVKDLRRDVIALYTVDKGKLIYSDGMPDAIEALVSRGDKITIKKRIPLPKKAKEVVSSYIYL